MMTINQAMEFLMANPCNNRITAIYNGERRRFFYNSERKQFGMYMRGRRKLGTIFYDWTKLTDIRDASKKASNTNITEKFKKKAQKASFTNSFIRNCLNADITKSPYLNNLTTGVGREGEIITLEAIRKEYPYIVENFKKAFENGETYDSPRVQFRGYDMTLSTKTYENGDKWGWLSMEYRDCCNGHYYLLINDTDFIYTDKD